MNPIDNFELFSGRDELVNKIANKMIYQPEKTED